MPKARKPRPRRRNIADTRATAEVAAHDQALTHFAGRRQPKRYTKATIAAAGKAAYESWVEHAGFKNDARIAEWGKLQEVHRLRWGFIARAVLDAADSAEASRKT